MSRTPRDYRAEYRRRIARGAAKGISRSQARGHPRAAERRLSTTALPAKYDRKLEEGVKALRRGKRLTSTARELHVSPERLRAHVKALPFVEKRRGRFFVGQDARLRRVEFYSDGRRVVTVVRGYDDASLAGSYWAAVGEFLDTNDTTHLAPYAGVRITDARGRVYPLETRPNVLYRLDAAGGDTFEQVYRIVL